MLIATGDVVATIAPLTISLPGGAPANLVSGSPTNFNVTITPGSETLVPGSAHLFYSYDGGAFQSVPLSPSGGDNYVATLPAALCDDTPRFYVTAAGNLGASVSSPPGAPANFYQAMVGTMSVRFTDNFQTNQLWTVSDTPSGGGAFTGTWQRGVPVAGATAAPTTDADGSGQCYLTDNSSPTADIDNGLTTLASPAINITGLTTAEMSYARWYSNSTGAAPQADTLHVHVSDNNGLSWVLLETVGPTTSSPNPEVSGGWFTKTYSLNGVIAFTNQFRVRFSADDAATQSFVEAAIDAVVVRGLECDDPVITPPAAPTGVSASNGEDCANITINWNSVVDATDYEVWRNTTDDSGSATSLQIGIAGQSYDDNTAAYGSTYYYWVKACNAGGCSPFSLSDSGDISLTGDFTGDGLIDGADVHGFADAHLAFPAL
ncbi:MAG: hypothetical protein IPK83_15390 [Planctomycetes bacterium]|nr:hypothetical protein [Planctomycetota bacterium]